MNHSPTRSNSKKNVALAAIILLGCANAFLSFLAYQGGIGKLKSLDAIWGPFFSFVTAIFLAIGITLVEYLVNAHHARGEHISGLLKVVSIILLVSFAFINIGAGTFRLNENARESQNAARLEVSQDPRWVALEKDLAAQHGILKNGALGDDAQANARIRQIMTEMQILSEEYVRNSNTIHQASASNIIQAMFGTYQFFITVFLVITLAYGYAVQYYERQPKVSNESVNQNRQPLDKKPVSTDAIPSSKPVNHERQPLDKKPSSKTATIHNLVDKDVNRKIVKLCQEITYENGKPKFSTIGRELGVSRQYVWQVWTEYNS